MIILEKYYYNYRGSGVLKFVDEEFLSFEEKILNFISVERLHYFLAVYLPVYLYKYLLVHSTNKHSIMYDDM